MEFSLLTFSNAESVFYEYRMSRNSDWTQTPGGNNVVAFNHLQPGNYVIEVRALENGGLLTEYPSETEPLGANFLRRNRIIAGLADAVVIVESQERGGSLVTARMACDYNRDLFAFPGRPEDITSNGCNELICSQRAYLIQSADDLIRTMGWTTRAESRQPVQTQLAGMDETLSETQQAIVSLLGEAEEGLQVNLIVMEAERSYAEVSSDLLELEVQGLVRSLPGGFYRLVR
jgi:DNA processing protein